MQVSTFDIQLFEFNFNPLVSDRWRSWAQLTLPTPAQMMVESRSRDFPVEWTKETFSTPDNPDVDTRRQQIEHGRSPGCRCTVFEGGGCCPTDCLIWKGVFHEKIPEILNLNSHTNPLCSLPFHQGLCNLRPPILMIRGRPFVL